MRKAMLCLAVLGACDDPPPPAPTPAPSTSASASAPARTRLVYDPGSPLDTARVAARLRKRLGALGLAESVEIGGERIVVHVPEDKADVVERALGRGRLDVHVLDEAADVAEPEPPLAVRNEEGRQVLVGPERAALVRHFEGARVLTGPIFEGADKAKLFRAHPIVASSIRGEHLARAAVRRAGNATVLDLAFEGAGTSFVRWGSKQGVRFVLLVDGDVLSSLHPKAEIEDGQLAFPLEARSSLEATLKEARRIADELHGVALSHAVELDEQRP